MVFFIEEGEEGARSQELGPLFFPSILAEPCPSRGIIAVQSSIKIWVATYSPFWFYVKGARTFQRV